MTLAIRSPACATHSQERHDDTLRAIKGYCRQRTTEELLAELTAVGAAGGSG